MNQLRIFLAFTRPHTIYGTAISVATLYFIAAPAPAVTDPVLWLSLLSALACNVFITGYNQVVDVQLDLVNKPELPIASGALPIGRAQVIVWVALALSLLSAALVSRLLTGLITAIALLGFVYSWQGVFLKQHHGSAALAITLVRGVLVNTGFYLVFSQSGLSPAAVIPEVWLLVAFISLFSLGIAWFKDIPDVRGDAGAQLGTLALRAGITTTFTTGTITVATAYALAAAAPLLLDLPNANAWVLGIGHIVLGLGFLASAYRCDPRRREDIKRFYRRFWVLFFLEYALFGIAFWLS